MASGERLNWPSGLTRNTGNDQERDHAATVTPCHPSVEIDAIPSKRIVKRIRLFRQGELGRLILSVMRNANSPIGTHAIVTAIIKAGGHGPGARSAVMPRVRENLAYLHRREKVIKSGTGKGVR
jgi:hypothetical protein